MIDTQNEKNRISEMAIRGNLSHRIDSAMSIDDIIYEIRLDRDSLIKDKKSKISKVSEMLAEDIFEIPSGWKWVALGDLCILLSRGKSPTYSEVKKYPVFAQKCNQPQHLALEKALFLDESTLNKWPEYFKLRDADVVINSTGTGTVGRVGYFTMESLDPEYEFIVPDSHVTVVRVGNNVISKYIYYALRTKSIQTIMEKTFRGSTNQKEFYIESVYSIPIPLPPTEEQKEIVSILDEVYEQLDIIDTLQRQYESDLSVLKGKIIDAGIRGKLTEQLPEDGDAETLYSQIQEEKAKLIKEGKIKKEKPLPEISADEIPFEIPKNWKWVRLQDVALTIVDCPHSTPKYYEKATSYFAIDTNCIDENGDITGFRNLDEDDYNKRISRLEPKFGDIVYTREGSICRAAVLPLNKKICLGQRVMLIRCPDMLEIYYIKRVLMAQQMVKILTLKQRGIGVNHVNVGDVCKLVIPLPPLTEQKRIAKKISELSEIIS